MSFLLTKKLPASVLAVDTKLLAKGSLSPGAQTVLLPVLLADSSATGRQGNTELLGLCHEC